MDFVVGHPRSGTALLAGILNAGGGAPLAEHEWLAKLSGLSVAAATEYHAGRRSRESIAAIVEHYRYGDGRPIRIDSNWKLSYILDVLLAEFPRARVLHLARHPVDNVSACMSLDFYGPPERRLAELEARNYWLAWMPRIERVGWDDLSQLEKNCAFWCETHRLVLAHTRSHATVMTVRLEDLDVARAHHIRTFFGLGQVDDETLVRVLAKPHNDRVDIRARLTRESGVSWPPMDGDALKEARATIWRMTGEIASSLGYGEEPSR